LKKLLIIGDTDVASIAKKVAYATGDFAEIRVISLDDIRENIIEQLESYVCEFKYAFSAVEEFDQRVKLSQMLEETSFRIAILVSPKALISPSAQIMNGTVIDEDARIGNNAVVAQFCCVCRGATIDDNCFVGDCCFIGEDIAVKESSFLTAGTVLN